MGSKKTFNLISSGVGLFYQTNGIILRATVDSANFSFLRLQLPSLSAGAYKYLLIAIACMKQRWSGFANLMGIDLRYLEDKCKFTCF